MQDLFPELGTDSERLITLPDWKPSQMVGPPLPFLSGVMQVSKQLMASPLSTSRLSEIARNSEQNQIREPTIIN